MSSEVVSRRRRLAIRLTAAALAWSIALLVTAVVAPLYDGQTTSDANGLTLGTATYVQRNGVWVVIPLVVPMIAGVATGLALLRPDPRRRRLALLAVAVLALLGVVLVVTGGVLLLVPAVLLALALRLTRTPAADRPRRRARAPKAAATPTEG